MYFDNLQDLLAMDGHGLYVWMAYFVTLAIIALVLIAPVRRSRRILQQLAGDLRRAEHTTGAGAVKEQ